MHQAKTLEDQQTYKKLRCKCIDLEKTYKRFNIAHIFAGLYWEGNKLFDCVSVYYNSELDMFVKASIRHDAKPYVVKFLLESDYDK